MSKNNTATRIATYGVFFAVIFIAFNIDSLLSMILPIKFAIITVTTVTTLVLLSKNVWEALLTGVFFGLSSLISQFYLPKVPEFLNPLCSVLPRMCVGAASFGIFRLMRWLTENKCHCARGKSERISCAFSGATSAIVNTALVMLMLSVYRTSPYLTMIEGVLVANFIPEAVGAIVLVPFIAPAVAKASKRPLGGIPVQKNA